MSDADAYFEWRVLAIDVRADQRETSVDVLGIARERGCYADPRTWQFS